MMLSILLKYFLKSPGLSAKYPVIVLSLVKKTRIK
jgi:hypothetical protein